MEQPDIQKHLNAQIARLVMELATAHAVIEQLQSEKSERASDARTTPESTEP